MLFRNVKLVAVTLIAVRTNPVSISVACSLREKEMRLDNHTMNMEIQVIVLVGYVFRIWNGDVVGSCRSRALKDESYCVSDERYFVSLTHRLYL
jgi:hypothetical protein